MKEKILSLRVKLGFGVCDLGGNLFFTMMGFHLLFFLTDITGLGAGLAGTALMIGKIWDAVTDPAVGVLSDRTQHRWGRRRPYIFYGVILSTCNRTEVYTVTSSDSQSTTASLNFLQKVLNIPRAPGDPEAGKAVYEEGCARCHSRTGLGDEKNPMLAGQHTRYLHRQIELFLAGRRDHKSIDILFGTLSSSDIDNVLAHLSLMDDQLPDDGRDDDDDDD